jgi:general secretion pathway protein L
MSERLLLRLHESGTLTWLIQGADSRALVGTTVGVPSGEVLAHAARIVVLVPSEHVLLLDAPVVSRQRAQLARAVPFALEDRLAGPVEDLHFALGTARADATIPVAVVARETLRNWIQTLAAQGIRPDLLIPESLALPQSTDHATLLIETDRAQLRSAAMRASVCEVDTLDSWLRASAPSALEVFDFRAGAAQTLPVKVVACHEHQRDALSFFAAHLPTEPEVNLLQGEFAPQHRQIPALRIWRFAALLVDAVLLLGFVYSIGDWLHLRAESASLDTAMRGVLHASFPKFDKVDGDPHALMQSELARLRGDEAAAGVLHVIGEIAPVLGSSTRVVVKSIEYHNGSLELALRAPDLQALDLVREQLTNLANIKADVTSASPAPNDAGIDGRLRITVGKS